MRCTCCGKPFEPGQPGSAVTEDHAFCAQCEQAYQDRLAQEFPHGQCQECGAPGHLRNGKVVFSHVEGGCSHWTDPADEYQEDPADIYDPDAAETDELTLSREAPLLGAEFAVGTDLF
jgi:hypothetical protein